MEEVCPWAEMGVVREMFWCASGVGDECWWVGLDKTEPSASSAIISMETVEAGRTVDSPELQMSIGVNFLAERLFDFNHLSDDRIHLKLVLRFVF